MHLLGCSWTVAYSEFTVPLLMIPLHDTKIHVNDNDQITQRLNGTGRLVIG